MKKLVMLLSIFAALCICTAGCAVHRPAPLSAPADLTATLQSGAYLQKADNFLIILDASQSMENSCCNEQKLYWAKAVAHSLNDSIPDLKLTGGVRVIGSGELAAKETVLINGMQAYSRQNVDSAIEQVQYAGGNTPMALAIYQANHDIEKLEGSTAIILISDGKATTMSPVLAAEKTRFLYGDRVCIYTVQIGDDPEGAKTLAAIAGATPCGQAVTFAQVSTTEGMAAFVESVFLAPKTAAPAPKPVVGEKIRLSSIMFAFDSAEIRPEFVPVLEEVAGILKEKSDKQISIQGHTCSMGSDEYNKGLSMRRALSVKDVLVQSGISANRLSAVGYGEENPIATNDTRDGRKRNRRVEFHVVQ